MHTHTLKELAEGLQKKTFSSQELTSYYLKRIKTLDTHLNSFVTICEESAMSQAKAADDQIAKGNATPLTGIPIAQKDIFCTQGVKTSCASKMLDNFIAPYDATVIEHFNANHAVLLGKTNMDEFAMGSSNENSYYGPARNPWDTNRVPGGSSGGSAAAVAARLCAAATGTDTGGSIRQPAALCGVTGLKPSYGRVSRFGMIAFASSLDQGGPITQTAEDAALILNAIAKHDPKDATSMPKPTEDYTASLNNKIDQLTIGIPEEYLAEGLDPEVEKVINEAIDIFKMLGVKFKKVNLPNTKLAVPAYYVIAPAEASSNLARYDGVRYGYRCDDPKDLEDLYKRTRGEGFGEEVKRRIMIGTYALSSGYYDAYYLKAQKVRRLISNDFDQVFNDVDLILGPTTPTTAFKLGEKVDDPVSMYLSDIYTIAVNLAGLPGISIPGGFTNGLPVGVQLIAPYFSESRLLNAAHQFQCQTDWHRHTPTQFQGE